MEKQVKVMMKVFEKQALVDQDMVKLMEKKEQLVKESLKSPFIAISNSKRIIALNKRIRKNVIFLDMYTEEQQKEVLKNYKVIH